MPAVRGDDAAGAVHEPQLDVLPALPGAPARTAALTPFVQKSVPAHVPGDMRAHSPKTAHLPGEMRGCRPPGQGRGSSLSSTGLPVCFSERSARAWRIVAA